MGSKRLNIGYFSCRYQQINGLSNALRFISKAMAEYGHNVHFFVRVYMRMEARPTKIFIFMTYRAQIKKWNGFSIERSNS
ncbi:MAG: hypothetical protein GF311_00130 [Candidatus Lokiarchaeota archaeon]|nr:hypothetical protein [Candidatus Lokiarchaeota archaeon]